MSDNSNLASAELRHLDPATLHIDANVRADVALDKDFLASVRDYGVLVPIVAVETADAIRVRYGQRRTLAAIQGELESVPVYVTTEDGADEADRSYGNGPRTNTAPACRSTTASGPWNNSRPSASPRRRSSGGSRRGAPTSTKHSQRRVATWPRARLSVTAS